MHRPDKKEEEGAVFIRTMFGAVHESAFTLSRVQMILNEDWRSAVRAEGGPFCYTPAERLIPF
jgi:hypothetical protein